MEVRIDVLISVHSGGVLVLERTSHSEFIMTKRRIKLIAISDVVSKDPFVDLFGSRSTSISKIFFFGFFYYQIVSQRIVSVIFWSVKVARLMSLLSLAPGLLIDSDKIGRRQWFFVVETDSGKRTPYLLASVGDTMRST